MNGKRGTFSWEDTPQLATGFFTLEKDRMSKVAVNMNVERVCVQAILGWIGL